MAPAGDTPSLWERLTAGGGAAGVLSGPTATVRIGNLRPRAQGALRGRSVLLAMRDQLSAALAMIALDGIVRRMVLCPPDLPRDQVAPIKAAAEIDAVLSDGAFEPQAGPEGNGLPTEWVLLTSGTTGAPKLVIHDLRSLAGPDGGGQIGHGAIWSTFYDIRRYGGLAIFFRALLGGGSLVLSSAEETVAAFLARTAAQCVTHISGTPSHWRRALMTTAARDFAPRYVRLSGEIADQVILDQLHAFWPEARIVHAFAATEAGFAFEVEDGRAGFPASLLERDEGDLRLKVVDGTLRIRSSRTAARYLGRSVGDLGDEDRFVDTRDLVELRGDRYYFVGRSDGVVNVGGMKFYPEEVEAVVNAHPAVRMTVVRAQPNPFTGAVAVATVVSGERASPSLEGDILSFCRERLPRHKVPVSIRFVDELPVGSAGKLRRGDA